MEVDFHNVKLKKGSHRVTVGHPQVRHRIQGRTSDQHLRRLPGKLPRADAISKDRFHPEHLRLGQTAPMIANFLLPLFTSHLADAPQILIADQSLLLAIAMLPTLRIPLRRYRRLGFAFADRLITIALVIRASAANLLNLLLDLLKPPFPHLAISNT